MSSTTCGGGGNIFCLLLLSSRQMPLPVSETAVPGSLFNGRAKRRYPTMKIDPDCAAKDVENELGRLAESSGVEQPGLEEGGAKHFITTRPTR